MDKVEKTAVFALYLSFSKNGLYPVLSQNPSYVFYHKCWPQESLWVYGILHKISEQKFLLYSSPVFFFFKFLGLKKT